MNETFQLHDIQALIIDMDGVLWLDNTPLPGLIPFFDFLDRRSIPFILATNNASKTPGQYVDKLARFGVTISPEHVLTSPLATAAYLKHHYPAGTRVFAVGQEGILEAMQQAGFELVYDLSQPAEVVVAGVDFTLTYDKLKYAVLHIHRGARFVGTNGDVTFPAQEGPWPGAGSILAAIQAATGVNPVTIGKPERLMFDIAVEKMGRDPSQTAMLGDRLETDILGGQRAGVKTILVTTGIDNEASSQLKRIYPDATFSGLVELVEQWTKS
ncbi:MAG: haloacid dehalogenase [Anaerolineae bacterium]|nr:HAD-IIA family hydrolase [Anaerolineales bacterium]MCQ3976618.1 haloacid dehalogenase [Anaerolineae bacterium]